MSRSRAGALAIGSTAFTLYLAESGSPPANRCLHSPPTEGEYVRIEQELNTVPASTADWMEVRLWLSLSVSGSTPWFDDARLRQYLMEKFRSREILIADALYINRVMAETRARIVEKAKAAINSVAWSAPASNGAFGPGTNKCMLFVHDMAVAAGADPGTPRGWRHPSPPMAGDWANPNYHIPGWRPLVDRETPMPGDVVAQSAGYADASGHVMLVGPAGDGGIYTFIGTDDGPGIDPQGRVLQIPFKRSIVSESVSHGPEVFRRFDPMQ
jgi:hypothetical protein